MVAIEQSHRLPLYTSATREINVPIEELSSPLGDFSRFVVEEMPFWVSSIRGGECDVGRLSRHVEVILSSIGTPRVKRVLYGPEIQAHAVAQMMFAKNAIGNSGGEPGILLDQYTEDITREMNRPNTLTYWDSVGANPRNATITFTGWQTERDFYETHRREEEDMNQIIIFYKAAIDELTARGMEAIADTVVLLREAARHERNCINEMRAVGLDMNQEEFLIIREYFNGYPKGLRGASGAFSATLQIAYMLLTGWLHESTAKYLKDYHKYFPPGSQADINEAIAMCEEGRTLSGMVERLGRPPLLQEAVREAKMHELALLKNHQIAIGRQIPGALEGQVQGTGDFGNVYDFTQIKIVPLEEELAA